MTEAEGFVVQGNKTAWRKHALRAVLLALVAAEMISVVATCQPSASAGAHLAQNIPFNIGVASTLAQAEQIQRAEAEQLQHAVVHNRSFNIDAASTIAEFLSFWAVAEAATAGLLAWMTLGRAPLISVNRDGVLMKNLSYRSRRLAWGEIKSIYASASFSFPLFGWQKTGSIILVPHDPASFYNHLTSWERLFIFGSTKPNARQRAAWMGVSGLVMEISPDEFIRQLSTYYENYAWRPGLPGGPFQTKASILPPPSLPTQNETREPQSKSRQPRVLIRGTMQRRRLQRTNRASQIAARHRMAGHQASASIPAAQTACSIPDETDTRVTHGELTAAIDAIERRKAEAQRQVAETTAIDQARQAFAMDAHPEEPIQLRAQ